METSREDLIRVILESTKVEEEHKPYLKKILKEIDTSHENEDDFYRTATDIIRKRYDKNAAMLFFKSLEGKTITQDTEKILKKELKRIPLKELDKLPERWNILQETRLSHDKLLREIKERERPIDNSDDISREEFIKLTLDSAIEIEEEHKPYLERLFKRINSYCKTKSDLYRIATEIILNKSYNKDDALSYFRSIPLDKPSFGENGEKKIISLLDIIEDKKFLSPLESIIKQEPEDNIEKLTMEEVLIILEKELDEIDYFNLKQLMTEKDFKKELNLDYDTLQGNIPRIREKLEVLRNQSINGKIFIPKKRIVSILSDGELFTFSKGISYSQVFLICQAHQKGMSSYQAAEYANVNRQTVSKYWKEFGLNPHFKFWKGHQLEKIDSETTQKILEEHGKEISLLGAAKSVGVSPPTIKKYWEKANLEQFLKQKNRIIDDKIKKIYEAHEKGMSLSEAAEYAGVTSSTVEHRWKKEGLALNFEKGRKLDNQIIEKIYEENTLGKSLTEIATHLGISISSVKNYLDRKNLKSNFHPGNPLPKEKSQKILEAYKKGMSSYKTAKELEVSHTTILRYWKKAGFILT